MKIKIAQGFIIQVVDEAEKVLSTTFVPGDKLSMDTAKNIIDNGKQTFPLIKNGVTYKDPEPPLSKLYTPAPPSDEDSSLGHNDDMPFGKHKGQKIGSLPDAYINWGAENMTHKDMKNAFIKEQARRNSLGIKIADDKKPSAKGFVGFDDNKPEASLANSEMDDDMPF